MANLRRQFASLVQFMEQAFGPGIEGFAGSGQPWLAGRAFQQRCLQLVFERFDLPTQGRLGNKQPLGSAAEAAGFDDFDEIAQLAGREHKLCLFEMGDGPH